MKQAPGNILYKVIVPLTFTYRSKLTGKIIDQFDQQMDLPVMSWHMEEIEMIVKHTHVSHEQALYSLIKGHIDVKLENHRKEMQDDPELQGLEVTITIGKLTYNKQPIIQ